MASSPRVRRPSRISAKASRSILSRGSRPGRRTFEMARYGALAGWASQLGMLEAAKLLNETLQEEMNAEKLLTQIAKSKADKTGATRVAA
jgi:Domain of unknown function (DUF892)